ncbi:hypothetical protein ACIPX0_09790 [Streptomyces sp. NPDC090075]|uniref:hypothetical protein n=1 Tax=unclassified Streptomyces TaxID=2593676 RepID=UPI0033AB403B
MTHEETSTDAVLRKERFGALPERIRPEEMIETRPAVQHDPDRDTYDPDEFAVRYGL